MTHPYHSTDSHTFREWDGRQDALRKRRERLREYLYSPDGEAPDEAPGEIRVGEPIGYELGDRPYLWSKPKAEIHGGRYRERPHREHGQHVPSEEHTWLSMRGDPEWLGRLLERAVDYYLKEMERREPQEAAS